MEVPSFAITLKKITNSDIYFKKFYLQECNCFLTRIPSAVIPYMIEYLSLDCLKIAVQILLGSEWSQVVLTEQ